MLSSQQCMQVGNRLPSTREHCVYVSSVQPKGGICVPRPTQPSIDLDNAVFPRRRIERVLNVTLADDSEMPNNFERSGSQHVVFIVRQSLRRCDND